MNYIELISGGADKGLGNIATSCRNRERWPGPAVLQGFAYAAAVGNANIGTQQLFANTTFQLTDNMTWIKGKHVIKFGCRRAAPLDQRVLLGKQRPQRVHRFQRTVHRPNGL